MNPANRFILNERWPNGNRIRIDITLQVETAVSRMKPDFYHPRDEVKRRLNVIFLILLCYKMKFANDSEIFVAPAGADYALKTLHSHNL